MRRFGKFVGILLVISIIAPSCSSESSNSDNNDNLQIQSTVVTPSSTPQATTVQQPMLDPPTTPQPALPLTDDGAQIVARVNGEPVTLEAFDRAFFRSQTLSNTASYDALATSALNTLIEQKLISQAAKSMNIFVSEEEIEEEYRYNRELIPDDASWQEWLDINNLTETDLRTSFHENLLTLRVIQQVTRQNDTIPTVHARHILVETEQEANAALARVSAGQDFASIASEVSIDITSNRNGGDLDFFTVQDLASTTPELAELAFSLQPNEIAGPIRTQLGYHIIQTLEFGERNTTPGEQASVLDGQFQIWLQSQRETATIEQYIEF